MTLPLRGDTEITTDCHRLSGVQTLRCDGGFGRLYRRRLPEILTFYGRRLGDRTDAEDVTSAVFREALAKVHTFRSGSFRAWL